MEEKEIQAMLDRVKAQVQEIAGPLQKQVEELAKGALSTEQTTKLQQDLKEANDKLVKMEADLNKQGISLAELTAAGVPSEEKANLLYDVLAKNQSDIASAIKGAANVKLNIGMNSKGQLVAFRSGDKAADTQNTTTTGANQSAFNSMNDAASIRLVNSLYDGMQTIQRDVPWILQFVSTGNVSQATIYYNNEKPKDGDFIVKPEGTASGQLMYKFDMVPVNYKTYSGYVEITREWERDLSQMMTEIYTLLNVDLRIKINNGILTDVIAAATAYTNPSLVGQIDNADDWAAIGAMYGQVAGSFGTPNVVLLNHNRVISTAATKDTTGQYVNYTSLMSALSNGGLRVFNHPSIAYGDAVVGDLSQYRVRFRDGVQVEIGTINNGLITGKKCIVVFADVFSYISDAKKVNIVKGTLNTIKASIEKP